MNKKVASSVVMCGFVGFHFICCGVPLVAAVMGVASPFTDLVSRPVMLGLMVAAAVVLGWSWLVYFRGCKCNKVLLWISTILFALAMAVNFIAPLVATGVQSCH